MTMTYSSALMINSLAQNYQLKQQLHKVNSNYLVAGIFVGIIVGGVIVYVIQKNQMDDILSNIRKQNLNKYSELALKANVNKDFSGQSLKVEVAPLPTKVDETKS